MLTRDEESEAEVRREDQENINKFGRLNARLHECRVELAMLKVRSVPISYWRCAVSISLQQQYLLKTLIQYSNIFSFYAMPHRKNWNKWMMHRRSS
jgi:hypothetical protein